MSYLLIRGPKPCVKRKEGEVMALTKQEFGELVAKAGAGTLSEEEIAELEPHRARNAVILAAGTCRRFAPISFDYPKSLTTVRGEVLIERQIRQLLSVGITDISILVGFMKDKFDYLVEKYGVKLIDVPEFATTNNLVSLYHARDILGGTYILLGDQFLTVNLFERYVYRSFYATTLADEEDGYVVETDPEGVVTDMAKSADGGEKLQGPCFVDVETGRALATALEKTRADWHYNNRYWEYAWYLHRDTVDIATRYYAKGVVYSFKTMDELYDFDDSYLIHVKSPSMDNICGLLNCSYEDMHDFEALRAGLTNYSVAFTVGNERYVYRHPVGYGHSDFDRAVETIANKIAFEAGVDPTFIYEDPEVGWKLCHFIKGAHGLDCTNPEESIPAAELLAKFHAATKGVTVDRVFDRWQLCVDYEKAILARGYKIDDKTWSYRDRMYKLAEYVKNDNFPMMLSHNDSWYSNFIWGEDGSLNLIDWEFAAMADWLSDIAAHTSAYYYCIPHEDREWPRRILRAFLGREETPEEWRHFFGLVRIYSWRVAMWVIDFISASDAATDWDIEVWMNSVWHGLEVSTDYALSLYENA